MGRPRTKPTGTIEEARLKAGLVHPLERKSHPDYAAERLDWDRREDQDSGGIFGALRRCAREAEEAVDNPTPGNVNLAGPVWRDNSGKPHTRFKGTMEEAAAKRQAKLAKTKRPGAGMGQGKGSGGRQPGAGNATPRILKELIFTAMDMVGRDGRGKDKAAGYLARVAVRHPDIFGKFIEKLIPYTLSGPGGGPVQVTYDDKDAILQRMKERGMPIPKDLMGPDGRLRKPDPVDTVQTILETPIRKQAKENGQPIDGEILPPGSDDE